MRFPAIALLVFNASCENLIESGTVATEIRIDSRQQIDRTGTIASEISGTTATEIKLNSLARYQRNAWPNITEMGGTMGSELSSHFHCNSSNNVKSKLDLIVKIEQKYN